MDHLENIKNDLTCPITLALFTDPITVPCCQKTFERQPLVQHLESNPTKKCPLCNIVLSNFDALTAPKNKTIMGILDSFNAIQKQETIIDPKKIQKWTADLSPIVNNNDKTFGMAELKISLANAQFVPRPNLFIAVVDRSGSMGGDAWRQVETALVHIMGLSRTNPAVKTVIVAYDSMAEIINTNGAQADIIRVIKTMYTGGGTNFDAAFKKIAEVLGNYTCLDDIKAANNVSGATIAFLTDGESGGDRNFLVSNFKNILLDSWKGPVTVHSIGFGRNCDREFLEGLWKTGNINGTFRYAEPQDNADSLCNKLTTLFETVSLASTVEINFELDKCEFKLDNKIANQSKNKSKIQFPISENGRGQYSFWLNYFENIGSVVIDSIMDDHVTVPLILKQSDKNSQKRLFDKWISQLIDDLAAEILEMTQKVNPSQNVFKVHCELITQKINAIKSSIDGQSDVTLTQRLELIEQEFNSVKTGKAVNKGKLGDLRFGGQYVASEKKEIQIPMPKIIDNKPIIKFKREMPVYYSRNNTDKNRNALQQAIINCTRDELTEDIEKKLNNDLSHTDIDGNDTLMLAAYTGHSTCVKEILELDASNLNHKNKDNETALTLAIKKNGFYKTIELLAKFGATIPKDRRQGLEQFCIENKFTETLDRMTNCEDEVDREEKSVSTKTNDSILDESMTNDTIKFMYDRALKNKLKIDIESYTKICLAKCNLEMIKILIKEHGVEIKIEMLFDLCMNNTAESVKLCEYLLDNLKIDVNQKNSDGDTLLFRSSERGSLDHVKLFVSKKAIVDCPNTLGNTPLWIACCNRFIDVVNFLISEGADVNFANLKGNTPITVTCQRGPDKLAQILLANGATTDQLNNNGDSLILLCCRNGQAEILKLLLMITDPKIVGHAAHIDGFYPILAATESNRPACIDILVEYGIDIEQKTAIDNPILAGATALHLAAYYNRVDAMKKLLSLWSNVNAVDINKCTPMHIAVIQGHTDIVKLLKNANANCHAKDILGNTPLSYCRDNNNNNNEFNEIKQILLDPFYDILMSLSRGEFTKTDEKSACELLENTAGVLGCLEKKDCVDIIGPSGKTPLMEAIIYSTYEVVKTLLKLGADPTIKNSQDINSLVWAEWIGNVKIKQLFPKATDEVIFSIKRLKDVSKMGSQNASSLSLISKPQLVPMNSFSGLYQRMTAFVDNVVVKMDNLLIENTIINPKENMSLIEFFDKNATLVFKEQSQNIINNLIWNAKISAVNLIASGIGILYPQHMIAIYMYTSNSNLSSIVNNYLLTKEPKIMKQYADYLLGAINSLLNYEGEVFRGIGCLENRKTFMVGNKITWPVFVSGTTIWKIATENAKNFSTKKKEGTIFLIKSKTGKYIAPYSQFSRDNEIVFMPNTKFTVSAWYHGDIIALGQSNIRASTFKIRPEEMDRMITSNQSLIIELLED